MGGGALITFFFFLFLSSEYMNSGKIKKKKIQVCNKNGPSFFTFINLEIQD